MRSCSPKILSEMSSTLNQEIIQNMPKISFPNKNSRYRNNIETKAEEIWKMIEACQYQFTLTPQIKRLTAVNELPNLHKKKRIGSYSYYLDDVIGSGFSSRVYRGIKNDIKDVKYAIKVINLSKMSKGNYSLLQNEISILKKLEHPNIIKLHEVFKTQNNCYLIMDFCEGGTLQKNIETNSKLEWKDVFGQLMEGCLYLESHLIIHRDIKPANIFLKGKEWKIGDFGFARYVPYKTAQIQELYMIGSPLYMPPETLEKNIYSLKTDSFALGILFFHLIAKEVPWNGDSKKELIESYANKKYPIEKLNKLPDYLQRFLKGLCEIEISQRAFISDFTEIKTMNFKNETVASSYDLVEEFSKNIGLDIVEMMKLCKFIVYIDANIQHFPEMCEISENLRRLLKFLALVFGWTDDESFVGYLEEFMCLNYREFCHKEELTNFYSHLQIEIDSLMGTEVRRCEILRIKLIQLADIIRCLIFEDFPNLKLSVSKLVLHADFTKVLISPTQINEIETLRNLDA